jgi:hypothetical protein
MVLKPNIEKSERESKSIPLTCKDITTHFPGLEQTLQLKVTELNWFYGPKSSLLEQKIHERLFNITLHLDINSSIQTACSKKMYGCK